MAGTVSRELRVRVGEVVARRYVLEELLGIGGMGAVYRAYDRELDEPVAVKLLRLDKKDDAELLDRFKVEVKLARRVTHRNVARTFELGEHDGLRFLTMELVRGESLRKLIQRRRLSVDEVVHIACGIASGLEAAHAAGVVHCDIKPDNVLIEADGRVVITDFGVARAFSQPASTSTLIGGTPAYISPEQIASGDITPKADIYGFGVLMYEALVGNLPWRRETAAATVLARIKERTPSPSDLDPAIPSAISELVLQCIELQPERRPSGANLVRERLLAARAPVAPPAPREVDKPAPATASDLDLDPTIAQTDPLAHVFEREEGRARSIAVLPFRGRDQNDDLAQVLTEDLTDALCTIRGLRVMSAGAVHNTNDAQKLGVSLVVDGSLRPAGDQTRVSVRLVRAADAYQPWAEYFERPAAEVLGLVDRIARAIARALEVEYGAHSREPPADPATLDLYLRARRAYHQMTPDDLQLAAELFERALAGAPNNPVILAGMALAQIRAWSLDVNPAPNTARLIRESAQKAIAAAPHLGEPHLALALARLHLGDPAGAARELRLAIARSPSLPEAHDYLGRLLAEAGRVSDGLNRIRAAIELDRELSPAYWEIVRTKALLGEWEEALALSNSLMRTRHARAGIAARMISWRRNHRELEELERTLDRRATDWSTRVALATIDFMLGRTPRSQHYQILEANLPREAGSARRNCLLLQVKTEYAAAMADVDVAVDALLRADQHGLLDLVWLMRCPLLESIRERSEFAAVRENVERRSDAVCDAVWG